MSMDENKQMVHRFFDERWNQQNCAVVDELLTADQVEEHKAWMGRVHSTVREMRFSIDDMVAEGDLVALHRSVDGVLAHAVEGVGAPDDPVHRSGLALVRVLDGKVVDDWAYFDDVGTRLLCSTDDRMVVTADGSDAGGRRSDAALLARGVGVTLAVARSASATHHRLAPSRSTLGEPRRRPQLEVRPAR
jgi:predicted ester cyclase